MHGAPSHPERAATQRLIVAMHQFAAAAAAAAASSHPPPIRFNRDASGASGAAVGAPAPNSNGAVAASNRGVAKSQTKNLSYNFLRRPF